MKKKFPEYYNPTEKELEELWENCIFIFDTSVILNLYEYSEKSRDEFLLILKKISDRIWIPFQVGKEYHSRRPHIIREQMDKYHRIQEIINESKKTIISEINKQKNIEYHPFIDRNELKKKIEKSFLNIDSYLKNCARKYPDLRTKDNIGEEIDNLFDNKVGDEYTHEKLKELYEIAKKRYEHQIPPGFSDKQKGDNKQYGDYISWVQIIEYAKIKNKSVIFVNDDEKNDWWLIHEYTNPNQEIIAPHPELIKEFSKETNNRFYMYNSENFMKSYSKFLKEKVSNNTIREVRNLRSHQFYPDNSEVIKKYSIVLDKIKRNLAADNLNRYQKSLEDLQEDLQKQNISPEFIKIIMTSKEAESIREKLLKEIISENRQATFFDGF
jgi:hypothetical protein